MSIHQKAPSQGQILQVGAAVLAALPRNISTEDATTYLGLTEKERRVAAWRMWEYALRPQETQLLEQWVAFYEQHFPKELKAVGGAEAVRKVAIPQLREGFDQVLVVLEGLHMSRVYEQCATRFPCQQHIPDLDTRVTTNDRMPTRASYAIRLRPSVDVDAKHRGKSATDVAAELAKGITLLERMLLELWHFEELGEHLDPGTITLCSGSRDAHGEVPRTFFFGQEFWVGFCHPSEREPRMGIRQIRC